MTTDALSLQVEHALISARVLERFLLCYYKFSEGSSVNLIHQGFHDTYLVRTDLARFILRIYRTGWKTFEQVRAEMDLLLLLRENGLGVSYPIDDMNGNQIHRLHSPEGERFAVIFSYAAGVKVTSLTSDQAILFGKHLAQIHLVTVNREIANLHRSYTVDRILESTLNDVERVLTGYTEAYRRLETFCKELGNRLAILNLKSGICHGDPHHENVFIDPSAGNVTFFDFDFCGNGFLLYDLGSFCYYERNNPENIRAFLDGYGSVIPLNKTEMELLPSFQVLMRLFHLGARSRNADGVRNPLWFPEEIAAKIDEIIGILSH